MRKSHRIIEIISFVVVAVLLIAGAMSQPAAGSTAAATENWPQWRGPNLDGTSSETGLPTTWSDTENVIWKLAVPSWTGATPIVWEDTIFLMVSYVERNGGGGGRRRDGFRKQRFETSTRRPSRLH